MNKHWQYQKNKLNQIKNESKIGKAQAISEIPSQSVVYDSLVITRSSLPVEIDIDIKRRHLQIQIALIEIGVHLGFRTWIAHNYKGFTYGKKKVGELEVS